MQVKRRIGVWLGAGAIVAAGFFRWETLSAGEQALALAATDKRSEENYRTIDSKLKLLAKLVNESAAAARISDSGNERALELLAEARTAWQQASRARDSGNLNASEQHVKQGLQAISSASRMVEDVGRANTVQQQRYQQLRKRVLSFSEAFQRAAAEKPGQSVSDYLNLAEVSGLLKEAEGLAHEVTMLQPIGVWLKQRTRLSWR